MADYRRTLTLVAGADRVFEYLADVRNLPTYFDRMTSAEPAEGKAVRVKADLGDQTVEGEAWFRVDRTAHRIQWGSEGPNDYHGTLEVTAEQDRSRIELELHTTRGEGAEIEAGLDRTLERIEELLTTPPQG